MPTPVLAEPLPPIRRQSLAAQQKIVQNVIIDGSAYEITLFDNPTIDDVVVAEARIHAASIDGRPNLVEGRVVSREIRDFLIRLGVDK
jgi:hypothetical protein